MGGLKMRLFQQIVLLILLIVCKPLGAQNYIVDSFDGNSLAGNWYFVAGDSTNFSVENGLLNAVNTIGGGFDGTWNSIVVRTNFFAPNDFSFYCKFNYQRIDYRTFDIFFRDSNGISVSWFRLWDSPSDWILLGKRPANPECPLELPTSYVPADVRIYRTQDTVRAIWDGVEQWKCHVADTISFIDFKFEDCCGGNVVGLSVDSVHADACCIGNRGDINGDDTDANILDLTYLVDYIFRGGPAPGCPNEADVNSDGTSANILDLTFLVDRVFRGGPAPGACI